MRGEVKKNERKKYRRLQQLGPTTKTEEGLIGGVTQRPRHKASSEDDHNILGKSGKCRNSAGDEFCQLTRGASKAALRANAQERVWSIAKAWALSAAIFRSGGRKRRCALLVPCALRCVCRCVSVTEAAIRLGSINAGYFSKKRSTSANPRRSIPCSLLH
jgi:hypothetical protein